MSGPIPTQQLEMSGPTPTQQLVMFGPNPHTTIGDVQTQPPHNNWRCPDPTPTQQLVMFGPHPHTTIGDVGTHPHTTIAVEILLENECYNWMPLLTSHTQVIVFGTKHTDSSADDYGRNGNHQTLFFCVR